MPNTYVSLPGFDVDDKDIETQKVQNAVARVRFINEEITSRAQMKQYNCHEGALPFTKSYLLRPLFNAFLMSPKLFMQRKPALVVRSVRRFVLWAI